MMRPISEQDWNVMAFHIMAWYFVRFETETSSQVVLSGRLYVLLRADPASGYMVLLTVRPCTFDLLMYGVTPAFYTMVGSMTHSMTK